MSLKKRFFSPYLMIVFCNSFLLPPHLKAVDNALISDEDADDVARAAIPDEELAIVRACHDELPMAAQEVRLLDVRCCVASTEVSESLNVCIIVFEGKVNFITINTTATEVQSGSRSIEKVSYLFITLPNNPGLLSSKQLLEVAISPPLRSPFPSPHRRRCPTPPRQLS